MKQYLVGYQEESGVTGTGFATASDAETAIRSLMVALHAQGEVKAWVFAIDDEDDMFLAKVETQVRVHSLEAK